MAYREIPYETRVNATKEAVILNPNIDEVAEQHGVSVSFLKKQFNKVHDSIEETIEKEKPGPKTENNAEQVVIKKEKADSKKKDKKETTKNNEEERPTCSCGSANVVKNGRYPVNNHLIIMLSTILPFLNTTSMIQRWHCNDCNQRVYDESYKRHFRIRDSIILAIGQLALILVFKHGLSMRAVSDTLRRVFGFHCSIGYIHKLCKKAGKNAKDTMGIINKVQQFKAKMSIFDETFPKVIGHGSTNLGALIDENGLIRGIGAIGNRTEQLKAFFESVFTTIYSPLYFISDFDPSYHKIITDVFKNISIWKDTVHAKRSILRSARSTLSKLKVKTRGKITKKKQKELNTLKRNLLRKQLYPILFKMFKGFKLKNAPICYFYFVNGLQELKELADRFPSLEEFYKTTNKFMTKYIDTFVEQMAIGFQEGLPTTSNSVESKNSLFSIFKKRKKCFGSTDSMVEFYCAVALMENYDIKTRGMHQGTNAMMRSGIDLSELGGQDFFEAIKIHEVLATNGNHTEDLLFEDVRLESLEIAS